MTRWPGPIELLKESPLKESKTLLHYLTQLSDATRKEWLNTHNPHLNHRKPGDIIVLDGPRRFTEVIAAFKRDHPSRVTPMDDPEGIATLVAYLLQSEGKKHTKFTLVVNKETITIDTNRGEVFEIEVRSLGYAVKKGEPTDA